MKNVKKLNEYTAPDTFTDFKINDIIKKLNEVIDEVNTS